MYGAHVFFPDISELGNPVDFSVFLTYLIPFRIGIELLDVRVFIQIIIQGYKSSGFIQLNLSVAAVYEIRVFPAGDHCSHGFLGGLACQPGFLDSGTCDIRDSSLYFVVVIDLCSGNGKECGVFPNALALCFAGAFLGSAASGRGCIAAAAG